MKQVPSVSVGVVSVLMQLFFYYQTIESWIGCPGVPFAERTLWINIAILLWTFNIRGSKVHDAKTGLPFHYDDSDAAFRGNVRRQIETCRTDADYSR